MDESRLIQRTIRRNGFRPLTLTFFTTLPEPADEIVALYQQRERIENDIRSLKYILEMEMFGGKTPEVIEKELLLGFAANNLVRAVLARGAKLLGLKARQISFSRGARLTQIFGTKLRDAKDAKERKQLMQRYLTGLNQIKHPNRKRHRTEPRKVVRQKRQFSYMKKSRQEARQDALKIAQAQGHFGYSAFKLNKN